jgi:protein ImuA
LDRQALLAALRARVARIERAGGTLSRAEAGTIPLAEGMEAALPGGGLARAGLHEVLAGDPGAAAGFCAMVLGRTAGPVLWIGPDPDAWPPGLARFGLSPAQLVMVRAGRKDALWAMEEALRCPAVTGALLALDAHPGGGKLDLTATRRLQLAAETGGALGLLLRPDAACAEHTAAVTRWRVGSLGAGHGLENPRWQLELLRVRGSQPSGPWAVTWRAATGRLDLDEEATATGAARRTAG